MIEARVIEDSYHPGTKTRMISVQTKAPKFLDAEIEKHRMISTNSSSDRAVPVKKMCERPMYIPEDIRLNQSGMQGYEQIKPELKIQYRKELTTLVNKIQKLNLSWSEIVHKQTLNRNLLGWSMQDKIMTATKDQWDYFFGLRCDEMADPSIQILANSIKDAILTSEAKTVIPGQWHLPYIQAEERYELDLDTQQKCSVARCARVSYLNHDNSSPNIEKDLKLYDMLKESKHWSCFEHQATPMKFDFDSLIGWESGVTHSDREAYLWSANFRSWIQYRKLVDS